MLVEIGAFVHKSDDFDYDAIGISEDGKTLGIGFINNHKSSILLTQMGDQINVSFNKNISHYEAFKFFMLVLEKIPANIVVTNDFY
jgi:hypothetical protein